MEMSDSIGNVDPSPPPPTTPPRKPSAAREKTHALAFQTRLHERWLFWPVIGMAGFFLAASIGPKSRLSYYDVTTSSILSVIYVLAFLAPVLAIELALGHRYRSILGTGIKPPLLVPLIVAVALLISFQLPPKAYWTAKQVNTMRTVALTDFTGAAHCDNPWNTAHCCDAFGFEESNCSTSAEQEFLHSHNVHTTLGDADYDSPLDLWIVVIVCVVFLLIFACNCFGPCWLSGSLILIFVVMVVMKIALTVRFLTLPNALHALHFVLKPSFTSLLNVRMHVDVIQSLQLHGFVGIGVWLIAGSLCRGQQSVADVVNIFTISLALILNLMIVRLPIAGFAGFLAYAKDLRFYDAAELLNDKSIFYLISMHLPLGKAWAAALCAHNFLADLATLLLFVEVLNTSIVRSRDLAAKRRKLVVYRPLISLIVCLLFGILTILIACRVPVIHEWFMLFEYGFSVFQVLVSIVILMQVILYLVILGKARPKSNVVFALKLVGLAVLLLVCLWVIAANVFALLHDVHGLSKISWWKAVVILPLFLLLFIPLTIKAVA